MCNIEASQRAKELWPDGRVDLHLLVHSLKQVRAQQKVAYFSFVRTKHRGNLKLVKGLLTMPRYCLANHFTSKQCLEIRPCTAPQMCRCSDIVICQYLPLAELCLCYGTDS